MLEIIKAVWAAISGKKVNSGALLTILGVILSHVGFGAEADDLGKLIQILIDSGAITMAAGLLHKLIKHFAPVIP